MTSPIVDITGSMLNLTPQAVNSTAATDGSIFGMLMSRAAASEAATSETATSTASQQTFEAASLTAAPRVVGSSRVTKVGGSGTAANGLGPVPSDATPIERLKRSLEATGEPLEEMTLPANAAERLEDILVRSGYSQEAAQQIIKRATDSNGNINLGALFRVMAEYQASEGPVLAINISDKPLLIQTLQELGLDPQKVREFVEALPKNENYLLVSGLKDLIAQAGDQSKQVDPDVLRDLLTRLGLSSDEADALILKNADTQGRLGGQAMLAMLKAAAATQGEALTKSLQELARQIQTNGGSGTSDAAQLKAQVQEILARQTSQEGQNPNAKKPSELIAAAKNASTDPEQLRAQVRELVAQNTSFKTLDSGASQESQNFGQLMKETQGADQALQKEAANLELAANRVQSAEAGSPTDSEAAGQGTGQGTGQAAAEGLSNHTGVSGGRGALPAHVVRQVSTQIAQMAKSGDSVMSLQLKPAHLGQLNLRLEVADGAVRATVVAESAAAKGLLESGLAQLKEQLALQGLKLERFDIAIDPDAERGQQTAQGQDLFDRRQQGGGGQGGGGAGKGAEGDSLAQMVAATIYDQEGRLSVIA